MSQENRKDGTHKKFKLLPSKLSLSSITMWGLGGISLLLIGLISILPIASQSVVSRMLDGVGAHRAALGVDALGNIGKFNYLTNFSKVNPDLENCDPIWDAYKNKSIAAGLFEFTSLPNATYFSISADDSYGFSNQTTTYRNQEFNKLAIKDTLEIDLPLEEALLDFGLTENDIPGFLIADFEAVLKFHVITDLSEDDPSGFLSVDNLKLTSNKGFVGDFKSNGYYQLDENTEIESEGNQNGVGESNSDESESEIDITKLKFNQLISDETGKQIASGICKLFDRYEIGSAQKVTLAGVDSFVRPITFYPKDNILMNISDWFAGVLAEFKNDSTYQSFIAGNYEDFKDEGESKEDFAERIAIENEQYEQVIDEYLESYEQNKAETQSAIDSIGLTVMPITTYIGMEHFDVTGYQVDVVVEPTEETIISKLNFSVGQYRVPSVMKDLDTPKEFKPVEELLNDFMESSIYTNVESEINEFNDNQNPFLQLEDDGGQDLRLRFNPNTGDFEQVPITDTREYRLNEDGFYNNGSTEYILIEPNIVIN